MREMIINEIKIIQNKLADKANVLLRTATHNTELHARNALSENDLGRQREMGMEIWWERQRLSIVEEMFRIGNFAVEKGTICHNRLDTATVLNSFEQMFGDPNMWYQTEMVKDVKTVDQNTASSTQIQMRGNMNMDEHNRKTKNLQGGSKVIKKKCRTRYIKTGRKNRRFKRKESRKKRRKHNTKRKKHNTKRKKRKTKCKKRKTRRKR